MHSRDLVSAFLTCLLSSSLALASSTGWVAFSDPGAPFSISLPADYGRDEALIADNQHHGIHAYYFRVPERFARGTNLSPDSHLSVEVDFSGGACTPDFFQGNASGYYVETQGPITFNVSKTGDAGAGNFYEDDVYAVAGSKPCIAVRYFIHSHNIGNYDPGSVRAYDAEGLIREFDAIRRTLVIRH